VKSRGGGRGVKISAGATSPLNCRCEGLSSPGIGKRLATRRELLLRMPFLASVREAHFTAAIAGTAGSASTVAARDGRVNSFRMCRHPTRMLTQAPFVAPDQRLDYLTPVNAYLMPINAPPLTLAAL
jgi:hypothetical protein